MVVERDSGGGGGTSWTREIREMDSHGNSGFFSKYLVGVSDASDPTLGAVDTTENKMQKKKNLP